MVKKGDEKESGVIQVNDKSAKMAGGERVGKYELHSSHLRMEIKLCDLSDKTLDSGDTMVTRIASALCHGAHISVGVTNNTIKEQVCKKNAMK